jgi:hypothetical protein
MKKLSFILSAGLLCSTALYAGSGMPQNPDHGKAPVPSVFTTRNQPLQLPGMPSTNRQAPAISLHKTAAVIWQLVGDRRDYYNATQLAWEGNDSTVYRYTPQGQRISVTRYDTIPGSWENEIRTLYVLDLQGHVTDETRQNWDDVSNGWINDNRSVLILAPSGDTLQLTRQYWEESSSTWSNNTRLTNVYDANSKRTQQVTEYWDVVSNTWINNEHLQIIYDGAYKVLENVRQVWDDPNAIWVNSSREVYTYTSSSQVDNVVNQGWDAGTAAWQNGSRTSFTYTSPGLLSTIVDQQWDATGSAWANFEQFTYTYDGSNRLWEKKYFTWNDQAQVWADVVMDSYTYNTNNLVTVYQSQLWNETNVVWDNYFRQETDYNSSDQVTRDETYTWSGTAWVSGSRFSDYVYDTNGNQTYMLGEIYNTSTSVYDLYSRSFFYYAAFNNTTGIAQVKNELGISVYPNPVAQTLFIDGAFRDGMQLTGSLSDMSGRVLLQFKQPAHQGEKIALSLPAMASGTYMLTLTSSTGQTSVVKLVR